MPTAAAAARLMRVAVLPGCVLSLIACQPSSPPPAPAAQLTLCDAKLQQVPKSFSQSAAASIAGIALDPADVAQVECIDATTTRHLTEIAAREQATGRAVADFAVARRNATQLRDTARRLNDDMERGWSDLASAHNELNRRIDALYRTPSPRSSRGIDQQPLLALALFDYARLVREQLSEPEHTLVRRLEHEKFCDGDLVGDRLLWRYFDAAVRTRDKDPAALAESASALRAIAIQSACLGTRQLYEIDRAMTMAGRELDRRLDGASLDSIAQDVQPFVFQVRLLIFDADKHLGVDAPGLLWWLGAEDLRRTLRDQAVWPLEHALWLYDRRTAGLVAVKTNCADGGTGAQCMNLSVFAESLTRPSAYGLGECSFLEMVEGGIRSVGGAPTYTCNPGICGTPLGGKLPGTALGGTFRQAWARVDAYSLPGGRRQTPFGVPVSEARVDVCGSGGFGRGDGGSGDGGPGMGVGGDKLACVLGERAEHTASLVPGMACIGRYVQATSPLRSPQEVMNPTAYAGIPRGCSVSDPKAADGGTPAQPTTDGGTDSDKKTQDAINAIKDAAQKLADQLKADKSKMADLKKAVKDATGIDVTDAQINQALNNLANATVSNDLLFVDGKMANGKTDPDGKITLSMISFLANGGPANTETMLHELVHSLVNISSDARRGAWASIGADTNSPAAAAYRLGIEEQDAEIRKRWLKGHTNKRCAGEDTGCSNACNGMNRQTQEALSCLNDALNPRTPQPRPLDLVSDPIDPAGPASSLAQCFSDAADIVGSVVARQCGAVLCANTAHGLANGQCCQAGGALEASGFGGRQTRICTVVRCEASMGASSLGDVSMCGCGGGYGATPGSPPGLPPGESTFPPTGH